MISGRPPELVCSEELSNHWYTEAKLDLIEVLLTSVDFPVEPTFHYAIIDFIAVFLAGIKTCY